jgi:tetratricopeptide (TPR) repeat protein
VNPEDARSYNNLAWLLAEEKGSQEEALSVAQRAQQLRPKDGRITDTVGWVYYKQGKLSEAERSGRPPTSYQGRLLSSTIWVWSRIGKAGRWKLAPP